MISIYNANNLSKILSELKKRGYDTNAISSSAKKGDINAVLNVLSADDRNKINEVLNNPELLKKMRDKFNG